MVARSFAFCPICKYPMNNTEYIYLNEGTSDAPIGNSNILIGLTPIKERKKEHIYNENKEMIISIEYT